MEQVKKMYIINKNVSIYPYCGLRNICATWRKNETVNNEFYFDRITRMYC